MSDVTLDDDRREVAFCHIVATQEILFSFRRRCLTTRFSVFSLNQFCSGTRSKPPISRTNVAHLPATSELERLFRQRSWEDLFEKVRVLDSTPSLAGEIEASQILISILGKGSKLLYRMVGPVSRLIFQT